MYLNFLIPDLVSKYNFNLLIRKSLMVRTSAKDALGYVLFLAFRLNDRWILHFGFFSFFYSFQTGFNSNLITLIEYKRS